MTETTSITVADGKYTVQHENGANLRALRYGEPWRDLVGDNLVYWMACRIEQLEEALKTYVDGADREGNQSPEVDAARNLLKQP